MKQQAIERRLTVRETKHRMIERFYITSPSYKMITVFDQ